MAKLNWFLTLRNMVKTDAKAAELFELLQKAQTDEEKATAKETAQNYIAQLNGADRAIENETTTETTEEPIVEENSECVEEPIPVDEPIDNIPDSEPIVQESPEANEEKIKQDLSQLAFTPRLAKCGITREEELFLNHVFVRKLSHEDKILMRRSIYQKKTQRNAQIQAEFKAKRIAQKQKDLSDPEKIKFHQERKYIAAVVDALENHRNMGWIFSQIEGLTPELLRDLVQKPENKSAIEQVSTEFFDRFYKKYGK